MKDLSGKCLIEIGGGGCAGCIAVLPDCRNAAEKFGLKFVYLDVSDDAEQVKIFGVERVPSIILADECRVIARCAGYQPQEILELWLEAKLNADGR